MFIMVGDEVSVENLLRGIIVASGNDACVALAEGLSGSEEDFVVLMNEKAEELGLENTNFNNSSGINDPNNYSTARDILIMSRYMIQNYPEYYSYFKETSFTWDRTGGDPITQGNRNPLLYKNIGADGIKTGFLTVEKYSLASSMKHGDRRINAVASGFKTKNSRSRESMKILNWGLKKFDTIIGVNNEMTNDGLQFSDEISKYNIGDTVSLTLIRKQRFLKVDITLKVFPVNADTMYSKIQTPSLPKPVQPEKAP